MHNRLSPQSGRGNLLFLLAAAAIVIATGLMLIMNQSRQTPQETIETVEQAGTVERTPPPPVIDTEEPEPAPVIVPEPVPEPLPALDSSDSEVRSRLLAMSTPGLDALLGNEALLRKFVVLVDNLARGKLAPRYNPLNAPSGTFTVQGSDTLRADPNTFQRYTPYVDALTAIPQDALVKTYWRYYPLLQQAYVDLGYPRAQFHPRMLAALDMLAAAPLMPADAELVQPKVLYQYADPELENLPAAQKQLMRMGPGNQAKTQQYLKTLRAQLTTQ
ncbi:MAG: DUF3014 domain-containing protein [Gammaproteobacteria bacterium]|nr:MAG: DUF3014 domain-containing protein [Gammaproteobacteria bacterium]